MYKVSLIIPCYNESKSLPKLIARCEEVFDGKDVEVVLVDNGSTDNTAAVMTECISKAFIRSVKVEKNQGYGFGILVGLKVAKGEYLGWTHADMQTDPKDLLVAMELLNGEVSTQLFIKGRRYGRSLFDRVFTFGMSIFETLLLGKVMNDINAQPTIFSKEFFASWIKPPHDFSLDLYAYYMAKKNDLSIKRFPVLFAAREHGTSHWNVGLKAKYKFIVRTITYSFKLRKEIKGANN